MLQYYGFNASVLPFCNLLETRNYTATPVESGLAAQAGVESALDAFLTALAELNYDAIPQAADDPVQDLSWMWQYCSEYGEHLLYSQFCFGADERRLLPAWRPRQPAVHRDVVSLARALPAAVQ